METTKNSLFLCFSVAVLISQNLVIPVMCRGFEDEKNYFPSPDYPSVGTPPSISYPSPDPSVGGTPPSISYPSPDPGSTPPSGHGSGSPPHRHRHHGRSPSHGGSGGSGNCGTPPSHHGGSGSPPSHHGGGSPPSHHGGGSYNPTPDTPSYTPTPTTPDTPSYTPTPTTPDTPSYTPTPTTPDIVSPPSTPTIDPGSPNFPGLIPPSPLLPPFLPDPNSPPLFTGTCDYWRSHPDAIWALLGWWGTMGSMFSLPSSSSIPSFPGAGLTLPQALANTRNDGIGALYREGAASLLNSMANPRFPYSTQQVRDQFAVGLVSNRAAAAQAEVFQQANEGRTKPRA